MSRKLSLVIIATVLVLSHIMVISPMTSHAQVDGCDFLNGNPVIYRADGYDIPTTQLSFEEGDTFYFNVIVTDATSVYANGNGLLDGPFYLSFLWSISNFNTPPDYSFNMNIGPVPAGTYSLEATATVTSGTGIAMFVTGCTRIPRPPNEGLLQITTAQAQPVYDSAGGGVVRIDGEELWIPQDYDGNGFDTYTITGMAEIDGELWYSIFLGHWNWVWVPSANVTVLE